MYIIKNAVSNILSSIGRNILIGIIVTVIVISSCITISIKAASQKLEKATIKNIEITGSILVDRAALISKIQEGKEEDKDLISKTEQLKIDELKKYADSKNIKEFKYSLTSSFNSNSLKSIKNANAFKLKNNGKEEGDFGVTGYSDLNFMEDFINGEKKLTSGKMIDLDKDEILISESLALANNLKIGDKIKLSNPNKNDEEYEYTISGFYEYTEKYKKPESALTDPLDDMVTSYKSLRKNIDNSIEKQTPLENTTTSLSDVIKSKFTFSNPKQFEDFVNEIKEKGLKDTHRLISKDYEEYEYSVQPLKEVTKFAETLLLVVLSVGGLILVALNMFIVRERKYEVGVLAAIGMKKSKVAFQFVIEMVIVTLLAVVIGTAFGALLAKPAANSLLASQINLQKANENEKSSNIGKTDNNVTENITAKVDVIIIGQLIIIGLGLSVFASSSSVIFILRYEPLKILSERT